MKVGGCSQQAIKLSVVKVSILFWPKKLLMGVINNPGAVKASHHPSSILCFEGHQIEIASMTRVLVSGKK